MKFAIFKADELTKSFLKENKIDGLEYIFIDSALNEDTDISSVDDAEIISVFVDSNINDKVLCKFKNLKMIAVRSTGYNNIDIDACSNKNIIVANTPAYGKITVAEFAFSLLLNLTRKVAMSYTDLKEKQVDMEKYMGIDLFGKTIGVVGTGAIGGHMAEIAKGFGMNVLAYDTYEDKQLEESGIVKYVSLRELIQSSDIISLHCPATQSNLHMLDEKAFNEMKKGVIIINTARGELIDTKELFKAVESGKVAGAGLDVLEYEGKIFSSKKHESLSEEIYKQSKDELIKTILNEELLNKENIIITPHCAFDTIEAQTRILKMTNDNIIEFLEKGNCSNGCKILK